MKMIHQVITHHKAFGKKFLNTVTIELPEVRNKAGQVIRKAMTYKKPVVKQITHLKALQR